ncbi:bacteriohemerythrin [Endothiovibrio diazotrophicus]
MIEWNDEQFLLGVEEMDETHREFVERVNRLDGAKGEAFAAAFGELLAHTREHFANEDRLMEESRFAATTEHRGEHRRVLADLERLNGRVAAGRPAMARAYLAEVPNWFRHHAATMDSALAAHLKR